MYKLIILINFIVFGKEVLSGGSWNPMVLIEMGAKVNELISLGEWWRLITPVFLHVGIAHLIANTVALVSIAPFVERFLGKGKFLLVYFLSAMGGNYLSYLLNPRIAAGASTAIFGMFGAAMVIAFKIRKTHTNAYRVLYSCGKLVLVNIILNIFQPGIDLFGHLGGFLGGLFVSAWMPLLIPVASAGHRLYRGKYRRF